MTKSYVLGGPWRESNITRFRDAIVARYGADYEACFSYVDGVGERFINKGIGLLAYDALLVALCAIPTGGAEGLSFFGVVGILLSVASALGIMWYALLVRWARDPETFKTSKGDFEDYVGEVATRGRAVNVGLYLAMAATVCVLLRLLFGL